MPFDRIPERRPSHCAKSVGFANFPGLHGPSLDCWENQSPMSVLPGGLGASQRRRVSHKHRTGVRRKTYQLAA